LAVVNLFRQEVWLIGDCQVLLGDQHLSTRLKSDLVLSEVRALALEMELLKGTTIDDLRELDAGRALIMPLLRGQAWFQNNLHAGDYYYAAIDGFPVPEEGIIIEKISPDVDCIILATDGYPQLCGSLEASESVLQEILSRDPLVFRTYKATKGMMRGNISYDDRAYVKIKLLFRC
jgi:glycerophosphoryl diester phosphodiesterase